MITARPDAMDAHRQHVMASLQCREHLELALKLLDERDMVGYYTARHAAKLFLEAARCLEPKRRN